MASSSATIYGFEGELQDQKNRLSSSSDPLPAAAAPPATAPTKRKRNQPGRPNPDAEVIALSPKTLMATNRFICEVCNKGFQREQNLRLHRRGHNLPWSLRQKVAGEVKQRVYICPEPTCVHHDPSRALGDLTGIKKHFFRKHGEKKWKCEKCSKHYAVLSDLKAHSKTCGTREYRCGCGTVFSRRDSFITHRAFCDALAQESSHISANLNGFKGEIFGRNNSMNFGLSQMPHQISGDPSAEKTFAGDLLRFGNQPGSSSSHLKGLQFPHSILPEKTYHGMTQFPEPQFIPTTSSSSSSAAAASSVTSQYNLNFFSQNRTQTDPPSPPFKLMQPSGFTLPQISENGLFPSTDQMGATASGSRTLFRGIESTYPSGNVHDAHLRDLMNSLAHGNVAVDLMGCSEEHEEFKQVCVGEEGGLLRGKEPKLQRGLQMNGIGGTAGFTRDFLGIGSMVRTMISERDQNTDVDFLPFESELASASSGRDFSGRGWP